MNRMILVLAAAAIGAAQPAIAQTVAEQPAPVPAGTAAAAKALADPDVITVRNVTRSELVAGLVILEDGGATIGTVARLAGNDVIIADGNAEYRVPMTQIYAYSQEGVDRYASRTPKAGLTAESPAAN
jgi:hypothetical protein